jgi:hypothetical protein
MSAATDPNLAARFLYRTLHFTNPTVHQVLVETGPGGRPVLVVVGRGCVDLMNDVPPHYLGHPVVKRLVDCGPVPPTNPDTGADTGGPEDYGGMVTPVENAALRIRDAFTPRVEMPLARRVVEVANAVGANPFHLAELIHFESAGRWSSHVQNPRSGATGLIQFMPSTARGLGTTVEALARLDEVDQMDWVERYLRRLPQPLDTRQRLFMAVFYPAAMIWEGDRAFPDFVQRANPGIATPDDYVRLVRRRSPLVIDMPAATPSRPSAATRMDADAGDGGGGGGLLLLVALAVAAAFAGRGAGAR